MPRSLQLNRLNREEPNSRLPEGAPEGEGCQTGEVGVEESPGFRDDQRGRDEWSPARMLRVETAGFLMMAV